MSGKQPQKPKPAPERNGESPLFVRRSDEHVTQFDPQRIIDALVREAGIDVELARQISAEIRALINKSGMRALSSSLIRELVDAKLIEHGLENAHRAHSRLGVPLYDVDRLIHNNGLEGGQTLGPEGTSLLLAEAIKREYAILSVFSDTVAQAHLAGDLHIENIGAIDRPHSIVQPLAWIKRYSVTLPQGFSSTRPARRPEVLINHLGKFSAALQGYLAGPIVWDSVNFGMAPYLAGLDDRAVKQLAQNLLFELSSPSVARGGQMMDCTLHLDWDVPFYLKARRAIGLGGEETELPYREYTADARRFLRALFEVYLEGDGHGYPFMRPQPIIHIGQHFIESPGYRSFLDLLSEVAIERGGLIVAFDRSDERAFWERYALAPTNLPKTPLWQMRSTCFQAVTLNLGRVALRVREAADVFPALTQLMELAAQAHLEKRVFLEKLLAFGELGPLSVLAMRRDNSPLLRLAWTTHQIWLVGLPELVRALTLKDAPSELHESAAAQSFMQQIVEYLTREAARLSDEHKVHFVLAESDTAQAQQRLARLDHRLYGDAAHAVVQGTNQGAAYYTAGLRLKADAGLGILERARLEGLLHQVGVNNGRTDLWLTSQRPEPESIAVLLSRIFYQSQAASLGIWPEFTLCLDCYATSRGLFASCPQCRSTRVDGLAHETRGLSRTSTLGASKLAELRARQRNDL